jgi:amino acid transporter
MRALKAQGISRDSLPYKAPFQPSGSYFALISTTIIVIFKGFDTFMPFMADTFITCVHLQNIHSQYPNHSYAALT